MEFATCVLEVRSYAERLLADAGTGSTTTKILMERIGVRNRFWPSEVFYRTLLDFAGEFSVIYIPVATAIEFFHVASLVHDDIIDQHDTRWNKQSLFSLWGTGKALLSGDYLLATALKDVLSFAGADEALLLSRSFARFWGCLLSGQLLDLELSKRTTISWDEYIELARLKTVAGTMATDMAASLCCLPDSERSLVISFAEWAGISSQIANDVSEIFQVRGFISPYRQDAGRGSELELGRKTIFHVFFHERPERVPALLEKVNAGPVDTAIIQELRAIGAIAFARDTYQLARDKAKSSLSRLTCNSPSLHEYLDKANPMHLVGVEI